MIGKDMSGRALLDLVKTRFLAADIPAKISLLLLRGVFSRARSVDFAPLFDQVLATSGPAAAALLLPISGCDLTQQLLAIMQHPRFTHEGVAWKQLGRAHPAALLSAVRAYLRPVASGVAPTTVSQVTASASKAAAQEQSSAAVCCK